MNEEKDIMDEQEMYEQDKRDFYFWLAKNYREDQHSEVEIGLMKVSWLESRRTSREKEARYEILLQILPEELEKERKEALMDKVKDINNKLNRSTYIAEVRKDIDGLLSLLSEKEKWMGDGEAEGNTQYLKGIKQDLSIPILLTHPH